MCVWTISPLIKNRGWQTAAITKHREIHACTTETRPNVEYKIIIIMETNDGQQLPGGVLGLAATVILTSKLGTCEASWFDSISNRTSDSRFDSYWWSDSKFLNCPRCQSSFVKKRLVVVKFAFEVDLGSKISVQQHCLTHFMNWIEINKYSVRSSVVCISQSFVTNTK